LNKIKESELILNPDGSIYHLHLLPGDVAKDIITVGDPERVKLIAKRLDNITVKKQHREFLTITGTYKKKKITVISTGIGTDNIDIVFTELDALFNVNFKTRTVKSKLQSLNFYRIGTSGSINDAAPVDSLVVSQSAIGFDGLAHFYNYTKRNIYVNRLFEEMKLSPEIKPYFVNASPELFSAIANEEFTKGITITADGFYNPQGRVIRLASKFARNFKKIHNRSIGKLPLTNMEMETAGIYLLAHLLGHKAISVSAILANRVDGSFSENPKKTIKRLIDTSLELISKV
jgi:uridine phosphorylase